jgi:small-conductance mechanosensitive channel
MGVMLQLWADIKEVAHTILGFSFQLGKSHISLQNVVEAVLACVVVIVLVLWLTRSIEKRVLRRAIDDLSLRRIATNVIRAMLLVMSLLITLAAIGVDLTALSIFGGALGVGLGFGMQKLAANYVSGFVVLFERSVRIGDNIRIDNFEGRITDITTRYTLVRAINGREAVIPNEKLMTERVENLSLTDHKILLTSQVSVAYTSDVELVHRLLVEAAQSCPRVLVDPPAVAHLSALGPDGLDWTLCYWITDPENGQLSVQSAVNLAVLQALQGHQIEIPYPQRVVHLMGGRSES